MKKIWRHVKEKIPMKGGLFRVFVGFMVISSALLGQEKILSNYRVGPQDLIEITVVGYDDLSQSVRVSEDGKIPFPYIGEVEISGLTRSEIEKKLKMLIDEKLLHDAQVIVFIREFHSQKVSLLGAITNPGWYELNGPLTLLQLISKAGDFLESAGNDILIFRKLPDSTTRSLRISIEDLVYNGNPTLDIPLQDGDIVNIPKDELVKLYFSGEVRNPGALEVRGSKLPTLLQAIIQQGGFTPKAAQKNVMIKRKGQDGKEQIITVNVKAIMRGRKPDVLLEEDDIIHVPETIF